MKTDKNSRTPDQGLSAQNDERAVSDINTQRKRGKYRIHLYWLNTEEAILTITATSLAEAEKMACAIQRGDLTDDDLYCIEGEIVINSVKPINAEESHE